MGSVNAVYCAYHLPSARHSIKKCYQIYSGETWHTFSQKSSLQNNIDEITIDLNFHGVYQLTGFCSERRAKIRRHEKTKEETRKTYSKDATESDCWESCAGRRTSSRNIWPSNPLFLCRWWICTRFKKLQVLIHFVDSFSIISFYTHYLLRINKK